MLTKIDITRDVAGCFYVPGDQWIKYENLKNEVDECLGASFSHNKNSFACCFQYQETKKQNGLYRRVKIYDNFLALLSSRSAFQQLGMNTEAIFHPNYLMGKVLDEAQNTGLTRIEISYYADTLEAEKNFNSDDFIQKATQDLDDVLLALNYTQGLGHPVAFKDILDSFQNCSKQKQLFVEMPDVCALVFSRSLKSDSYCGFF